MKNAKRILKGLILSLSALTVAFLAIALPFRLFGTIEGAQLRAIFLSEIAIYFVLGMIFIVLKERKKAEKEKAEIKRIKRRERFQQAQEEYYNLAA